VDLVIIISSPSSAQLSKKAAHIIFTEDLFLYLSNKSEKIYAVSRQYKRLAHSTQTQIHYGS